MNLIRKFLISMSRQISTILAIAAYENDRQSTSSSVGSGKSGKSDADYVFLYWHADWIQVLMAGGSNLSGDATGLYFNIVIFISAGFTIYFPFRQLAIQALSG